MTHAATVLDLCSEVAETLAEAGHVPQADEIMQALVEAGCLTPEKGVLGRMYMRMLARWHDQALELGQSACMEDSKRYRVAFLLGQLHELAGDPYRARKWLVQALQVSDDAPWRAEALHSLQALLLKLQRERHTLDITSMAVRA
jgi:hypothetical protein